jgi:hypothetical protein
MLSDGRRLFLVSVALISDIAGAVDKTAALS